MTALRTYMILAGAIAMAILSVYHFLHTPASPFAVRLGTLGFELLLSAIGFWHFFYVRRSFTGGARGLSDADR